jgi:hypothetical protein
MERAMHEVNPWLFGAALHKFQDWWCHGQEGYWNEHASDSDRAGAYRKDRQRPYERIQDFYEGGHWEGNTWKATKYGSHPRDEARSNVQQRNPDLYVTALSDNDLMDLYFRRGVSQFPGRQQRDPLELRTYFGLHTDLYFERSTRDTLMRNSSKTWIRQFLVYAWNGVSCQFDWTEFGVWDLRSFLVHGVLPGD